MRRLLPEQRRWLCPVLSSSRWILLPARRRRVPAHLGDTRRERRNCNGTLRGPAPRSDRRLPGRGAFGAYAGRLGNGRRRRERRYMDPGIGVRATADFSWWLRKVEQVPVPIEFVAT